MASEVRNIMGQVRRLKQPGPAAVKVVGRPRPIPKEGGECKPASVHAIWQEGLPKQKTKTGEAGAEQAANKQEAKVAAADARIT